MVFTSGQTETHSSGFLSVADSASTSGRTEYRTICCGRMVMHPAADFFVAGSNPGQANMAAAPPMAVDWQGFEPPTMVWCDSAAHPHCLEPWDDIWDDSLGLFFANDPKKGGVYDTRACT